MKNKKLHTVTDVIAAILISLFVICTAVTVTLFFRPLYYADIDRLGIEQSSGLSDVEIRQNYDALIDYNSIFARESLEFPTLPISDNGRIHFAEVKSIFDSFQLGMILFGIAALLLISRMRRITRGIPRRNGGLMIISGSIALALPIIVGAFSLVGWDRLFVIFHETIFDNDYWIFDKTTDPIISILPDEYFMHCLIMIVAIILVVAIAMIAVGLVFRRRFLNPEASQA